MAHLIETQDSPRHPREVHAQYGATRAKVYDYCQRLLISMRDDQGLKKPRVWLNGKRVQLSRRR
jgi:hypothetical protein